jgi:hypothetical protein
MTGPAAPPAFPTHVTGFSPRFLGNAPRVKAYGSLAGNGGAGGSSFSVSNSVKIPATGSASTSLTLVGGTTAMTDGSTSTYASSVGTAALIEMNLTGDPTPPVGATLATITVTLQGSHTSGSPTSLGQFNAYVVGGSDLGFWSPTFSWGGHTGTLLKDMGIGGGVGWVPGAAPANISSTKTVSAATVSGWLATGGGRTTTNSFRIRPAVTFSGTCFIYEASLTWTWDVSSGGGIPSGTNTDVLWDSDSINFDPSSVLAAPFGTSTTKLTPPTPGRYHVTSHVLLGANASGKRVMDVKK